MTTASSETAAPRVNPNAPSEETVLSVHHYTDRLFKFRLTRPASFRFRSGEFIMIGLPKENGKPLLRAYSVASPSWDEELEFYSIKVQDGPLTSRLQHIRPGDQVILRPKPTGTLVLDALLPGERLWLFATGTGIAPYASLIRDPDTYARYSQVILTHTCRARAQLAYGEDLVAKTKADPLVGEDASAQLRYFPTTTGEPSPQMGRITDLLRGGDVFDALGVPAISAESDRAMVCGSMGLNLDMKAILEGYGLTEGSNSTPAEYVVEKAFVG